MTISLANGGANLLARGLDSGKLKIYSGSVPANANASIGAAVLAATLTFNATSAPSASGGVLTFNSITNDNNCAGSAGAIAFFRFTKSDDTVVGQGAIGILGSGSDMEVAGVGDLTVNAGDAFAVTPFVLTIT